MGLKAVTVDPVCVKCIQNGVLDWALWSDVAEGTRRLEPLDPQYEGILPSETAGNDTLAPRHTSQKTHSSKITVYHQSQRHQHALASNFTLTRSNFTLTRSNFTLTRSNYTLTRSNFTLTRNNFTLTRNNFNLTRNNFNLTHNNFT